MPKKVELKVGLFVVITTLLILTSVLYIAYSKGFFSKEYGFTFSSKSGEDLTEGMPVYFSGFKIGRIEKLELSDQGVVLVKIKIPDQHVKWIKSSSIFSINKPLIGSSKLIVTTPNLNSPTLSPQNIPEIVRIDNIDETIKRVQPTLEKVDKVVSNIERITANLAKKNSIVEMVVGDQESARSIRESIKTTNDILVKVDTLLAKTDDQVYGSDGVLLLVRKILKDFILKLEKMNTALDNVTKISSDAADSTKDLKLLRAEIDSTVNAIGDLVNEIDKKIPLKKEPEIKLP
jgi:phospholipid/cholesterol/gamma-HCH transport system substrate-binding protein